MTPDRSHNDTVGRVANKVRVEWGLHPLKLFYVPKYRSSDTLPAPEIFEIFHKNSKLATVDTNSQNVIR